MVSTLHPGGHHRRHLADSTQGGVDRTVTALLDIRIATSLRAEQIEISARLGEMSRRLSLELMGLEKLRAQKAGLMDDLLTGRVRVTPLLAEAERVKECA
jgi:type I restriction enzyme S subunit